MSPDTVRLSEVVLADIRTTVVSSQELTDLVIRNALGRRAASVKQPARTMFDINGHAIWMARRDAKYCEALRRADVIHADGQSIVFASKLLTRTPIPDRSATTDFIHDVAREAGRNDVSFYLLGAREEINAKACEVLQRAYPDLRIAGRRNGYFDDSEVPAVIEEINAAKPDVLWVGLGKPREQLFAADYGEMIDAAWIVTCGGCLDFLAGNYSRAPEIMQKLGLEWLHRMVTGPRYLIRRYAESNLVAAWLLLTRTRREPLAEQREFPV